MTTWNRERVTRASDREPLEKEGFERDLTASTLVIIRLQERIKSTESRSGYPCEEERFRAAEKRIGAEMDAPTFQTFLLSWPVDLLT